MTEPKGCPRCGDQTLWRVGRGFTGDLFGWCRLCGHTWDIFVCDDPEGQWIRDQAKEAGSRTD